VKDLINIDNVSKFFIWLPPKTGTRLSKTVFENSDFHTFRIYQDNLVKVKEDFTHTHTCDFFKGHEDYKFILTCRNPYTTFVSMFKMWGGTEITEKNYIEKFEWYMNYTFQFQELFGWSDLLRNLNTRVPDYFLRIESLLDDYKSLPIIKKNKHFLEGTLDQKLSEKVGYWKLRKNQEFFPEDWRLFYKKSTADNVYYYFANYFEILGYERDSWKS